MKKFFRNLGGRDRPFQTIVALAVAVSAIYWLVSPSYRQLSSLGRTYGRFDWLYTFMYAIGGGAVFVASLFRLARTEVFGLILMAGAFMATATSFALVYSTVPVGARLISIALEVGLAIACMQRIFTLVWGHPK